MNNLMQFDYYCCNSKCLYVITINFNSLSINFYIILSTLFTKIQCNLRRNVETGEKTKIEHPIKSRTRFCPLLFYIMFRTVAKNHKFLTTCLVGTALGSSLLLKNDNRYPFFMIIHIGLNLMI